MMQATKNRPHSHNATVGPLVSPRGPCDWDNGFLSVGWNPRTEAHVRSAMVVMLHPFLQHHPQVLLIQRNQEVQTLAAKRSHQPFTVGIRFWRLYWRS
jgi:hypothetical protein